MATCLESSAVTGNYILFYKYIAIILLKASLKLITDCCYRASILINVIIIILVSRGIIIIQHCTSINETSKKHMQYSYNVEKIFQNDSPVYTAQLQSITYEYVNQSYFIGCSNQIGIVLKKSDNENICIISYIRIAE